MRLLEAEKKAIELMSQHGLTDWSFGWLHSKRIAGQCHYGKKKISLGFEITKLNIESEVINTILHEIAHALTPGSGHGAKWKAKCIEIGCRPERCFTDAQKVVPEKRYYAVCGACDQEHYSPTLKLSCNCQAHKRIKDRVLLNWIDRKV